MNTSLFELFKIGIGPSSSHTVGPMRAALRFARSLESSGLLAHVAQMGVELYGSLALTGIGHGTDRAVLLGLLGEAPDTVDPAAVEGTLAGIYGTRRLHVLGRRAIDFAPASDLVLHRGQMYPEPDRPTHPNGLRFTARDASGAVLATDTFYSIGGGFILSAVEFAAGSHSGQSARTVPFSFRSARELLSVANANALSIAELVLANEIALLGEPGISRPGPIALHPRAPQGQGPQPAPRGPHLPANHGRILQLDAPDLDALDLDAPDLDVPDLDVLDDVSGLDARDSDALDIERRILALWEVMRTSIERGIATEGTLPGGLNVRRRAPGLARRLAQLEPPLVSPADLRPMTRTDTSTKLQTGARGKARDPLAPLDAVTLAAMAVNEENAAGGRVVTAPTNGAAGVIPACAHYFLHHASPELSANERTAGLLRYFLTAAAIGILYKENASISGAEVGCQGEVGVACSMAAGGLVAALTPPPDPALLPEVRQSEIVATNAAIEHAAEIAMEHNLGMTCDPIGGLVQIPCIERNGMGAVKAVNAARLAMNDPGSHKISLDQVIETMYRTGLDMQSRYKETSLAGLALNIIEC